MYVQPASASWGAADPAGYHEQRRVLRRRERANNARSLGLATHARSDVEGTYRMRQRYYGERY